MSDRLVSRLHVTGGDTDPVVRNATASAAEVAGLGAVEAGEVGEVAAGVWSLLATTGFADGSAPHAEVAVRRHGHDVVVEILDDGLPYNTSGVAAVDDRIVRAALQHGWIDEFDHYTLGREGNRSVLVRHLPSGDDIRAQLAARNRQPGDDVDGDAPASATDVEALTERRAVPDDAEALARLTWRTYGYSYQRDEYYHPAQLADLLDQDDGAGWVLAEPSGEVVAHLAVTIDRPGSAIAEGGRGMVDPRYRGHGLIRRLGLAMFQWIQERGIVGLEAHAVTAHTRTQGGGDQPIAGLLLGYLPPVAFKGIDTAAGSHRQAATVAYRPLGPQPVSDAYIPDADFAIAVRIYESLDLERWIHSSAEGEVAATATDDADLHPHLDLVLRRDLGSARFLVDEPTAAIAPALGEQLPIVRRAGAEVIYVELPLADPRTPGVAAALGPLGFFFGGIVPNARADGDALTYQRVGDLVVDWEAISLASPMAHEVLEHIRDRGRHVGAGATSIG